MSKIKLLLIILSFSLFILAVVFMAENISFNNKALETTGTITDVSRLTGGKPSLGRAWLRTIDFETQSGSVTIERTVNTGAEIFGSYKKGQSVPILYNPQAPQRSKIGDFLNLWFSVVFYFISGLVILFLLVLQSIKENYQKKA